ncbi:LGFP repeat-containing protein [Tamaricihabitans halophyticus]|uniref:LGFP repeat-containing protein n=1 Tax=Tamaricihabitans halophyticus TaxID=1262583 RepID=A0A4R2QN33_9PSEU|nr:hypothetical protein [Tamaricihabitans halophyticus]TCP48465.1 LGFP repeat-containing protein [Tamaricihabitans halophyticus]
MTELRRYARMSLPVTGSALLALTLFAGPAGSTPAESSAAPARQICDYQPASAENSAASPIDERYNAEPDLRELLGPAISEEIVDGPISYKVYQNGRLYWSAETGVHEIRGQIMGTYLDQGGHKAFGAPITDECPTADGVGRYNHFVGTKSSGTTSIYWHPEYGAKLLYGPVRKHWEDAQWEAGTYGYPISNTESTPDGRGTFSDFVGDDGQGASIYWSQETGANGIKGRIRSHWAVNGATGSYLGYPTTDELDTPTGKRSNFEGGYITWNRETGEVADHPW